MLVTEDEVIEGELYFEQQVIKDTSHKEFLLLLSNIKAKLEANRPLKEIKKDINSSDINADMQDTLQTMSNEQVSNITGEDETISLGQEALAGYTFKESIKLRKEATKKQAIRVMAQMKEAIKDDKPVQEIMDNELKKYKQQLESFYRTQTKKAREEGYHRVDRKLSKKLRGWISVATLDNRTSAICISLHNKFYLKKDYANRYEIPNPPPRHPNCRSVLLAVWEGTRITDYKGQKIDTFLKNNPKVAQDILGQKKYRIFKTGKAKINSFVDIKGSRFYTNDEIIKRLGIKNKARLDKIELGGKV